MQQLHQVQEALRGLHPATDFQGALERLSTRSSLWTPPSLWYDRSGNRSCSSAAAPGAAATTNEGIVSYRPFACHCAEATTH